MSLAALLFAALLAAPATDLAGDARVAVVVGNNVGLAGEQPLEYAEEDAERFYRLLTEIGGVDPKRAYLVKGGDAQAVLRTLAVATGRLEELASRGPATLIVYVSAHADAQALHLEGTRLAIADLRAAMARSPASLRLAIIDACRTPVRTRTKGGRPGPEVEVTFDRSARIEGDVLITSAGFGEPAQEWALLRGSLFTHHLLTGLRGVADLDGDGKVSLAEAYSYAFRRTAALAAQGAGAQHPSFEMQMTGWGEWAFTRPAELGASLVLAEDLGGDVWITNKKNELVAEVVKPKGELVRVALRPAWYRVVRPDGTHAHVADVNLGFGGERRLEERAFVRTRLRAAVLRGSEPIVLRPWRAGAAFALGSGQVPGLAAQPFAELSASRELGDWLLRGRGGFSAAGFRGQSLEVTHQAVRAVAGAARLFAFDPLVLSLGAEAELSHVRQTFQRDDADQIGRIFGPVDPAKQALIPGAALLAGASIPFFERLWLTAELRGGALYVPRADGSAAFPIFAEGRLGLEWAL